MHEQVSIQSSVFGNKLSPFVKWPGGKSGELRKIAAAAPLKVDRFIEPFLGGGSVLLSVDNSIPALGNDLVPELIDLYRAGSTSDEELHKNLWNFVEAWRSFSLHQGLWSDLAINFQEQTLELNEAISKITTATELGVRPFGDVFAEFFQHRMSKDLPKKLFRIALLQERNGKELPLGELMANIEGSIRSSFYMTVRERYNDARLLGRLDSARTADFFFLREYSYASMFRFNSAGAFNVPYGGVSYNDKDFAAKVNSLYAPSMQTRLANSEFFVSDFDDFIDVANPTTGDFMFVDPPYDSDFTDYDNRSFRSNDQSRLAEKLRGSDANVMIVIGDTPLIRRLYPETHWRIQTEEMFYKWTVKSRNNRTAQHLTITNY